MRSVIFPRTLNRLTYFVRLLMFFAVATVYWMLAERFQVPKWSELIIGGFLCIARIACLDMPRLRNMQWSLWLAPLMVTPAVIVMQVLLFLVPPRTQDAPCERN